MTLQINYQPSAMLLGQMAQSAGESEYNRWLQGFNQQKSQSIANAFMGGFTQMGLPMAQMQSRENLMKQSIASRGQASAVKSMQDIEFKRNNMASIRDMLGDRYHSRYGADWANDRNLLHQWQQDAANLPASDLRAGLNQWMFSKNQDRSHRIAWSPNSQNARAEGNMANAMIESGVEPKYAEAVSRIQKGPYKPSVKNEMISSLNRQMSARRSSAGRPRTMWESIDENMRMEPVEGTDMIREYSRNPRTNEVTSKMVDKFEVDRKAIIDLTKLYDSLTEKTRDKYGNILGDEDDADAGLRREQADRVLNQIEFHSNRVYGKNLGAGTKNAETASVRLDADIKRWGKRKSLNPRQTNKQRYDSAKEGGEIESLVNYRKVDRESDLSEEDWQSLGLTSPRPYKTPATPSQQEEETTRKTNAALQSMKDPSGPPPSLDERAMSFQEIYETDLRGKTPEEVKGLIAAQDRKLENPDTYVFENGELRQMSKPELTYARQQESIKLEGIVQQEAAVEEQQMKQAIAAQGAKEAMDMLHPDWKSGQPAPVGWVKMQSSGSRAQTAPPVREWIVPTGPLMKVFKELKGLHRDEMLGKYGKQIHEEIKETKSAHGKQGLHRLNNLWKAYVKNMWEPPTRGIPAKEKERDVLLRKGSAAAVWLSYMEEDPDNVIDKFLEFVQNPKGQGIPAELREIADAYKVLAAAGVFRVMKSVRDPSERHLDPSFPAP